MADAGRLRADAAAIWEAAIESVKPERLVAARLAIVDDELRFDGRPLVPPLDLAAAGRIVVVGAGKAAAGMAAGVESLLGRDRLARHRVAGLVSVPAGSGRTLARIAVRETRPAAVNLPTAAVVAATDEMLAVVQALGPEDVVLAVVSGGGSALLCRPRPGVPLADKVAVTRFLAAAGADIRAVNLVRQAASVVKGGGLARACRAGRLIVLVLSDVIGDPLDVIASGPCMPVAVEPRAALGVLERFGALRAGVAPAVVAALDAQGTARPACGMPFDAGSPADVTTGTWTTPAGCRVTHLILGGNATAVAAAAMRARDLGYEVSMRTGGPDGLAETATTVGRRLAAEGRMLAGEAAEDGRHRAVIEGGEATVTVPTDHGLGGRNQQTVAAALAASRETADAWPRGLLLASVGTDGEDGPTAAAGGVADAAVVAAIEIGGLDPVRAVARCDALPLLESAASLIVTGPTGTNVADLRILLAGPPAAGPPARADGACDTADHTPPGA
ncbi:MAG: DUF4147 domain-containing protein [Planctomycetia bacterium]